jgi:hypothetical protein
MCNGIRCVVVSFSIKPQSASIMLRQSENKRIDEDFAPLFMIANIANPGQIIMVQNSNSGETMHYRISVHRSKDFKCFYLVLSVLKD